jgi:hypothetical protein
LEFTKSDIVYIPLRPEIKAKLEATTEIVADTTDAAKSAAQIDALNHELEKANLIGEPVQILSPSIIWTAERIDEMGKTVREPVFDSELLKKRNVAGIFLGVTELETDGQRIVMYNIDVDFDDATMTSRSVMASVDESTLLVATEGSPETQLAHVIAESARMLAAVEDPKFKEVFNDLMDLLEEMETLDATTIRELGILATWMMAHDGVRDNLDTRHAISEIIGAIIDCDISYTIVGQEIVIPPEAKDKKAKIVIKTHDSHAGIRGIAIVTDYEWDKDGGVAFEDTMQPALIILDEFEDQHYVPLKYITEFSPTPPDCRSSMLRFLRENPTIMKVARP